MTRRLFLTGLVANSMASEEVPGKGIYLGKAILVRQGRCHVHQTSDDTDPRHFVVMRVNARNFNTYLREENLVQQLPPAFPGSEPFDMTFYVKRDPATIDLQTRVFPVTLGLRVKKYQQDGQYHMEPDTHAGNWYFPLWKEVDFKHPITIPSKPAMQRKRAYEPTTYLV